MMMMLSLLNLLPSKKKARAKRTSPASDAEKPRDTNPKKKVRCEVCNWETETVLLLKGHMTKHSDIKCLTCDMQFKTMGLYRRHMKSTHDHDNESTEKTKETEETDSTTCSVCGFCALNVTHLKTHQMSQHGGDNAIYCSQCNFKSKTKDQHMKHMKIAQGHQQKNSSNKTEVCPWFLSGF